MLARGLAMLLLLAALASCGNGRTSAGAVGSHRASSAATVDPDRTHALDAASSDQSATGDIEVPDGSAGDGADAWSDMESEGLSPTFADANQDPAFDDSRDGTGCDVVDQDPPAGEMAADGDEVVITIDCAQVDWENQDGSGWEDFNDAYESAFDDGCQELFDQSPDGSLYKDGEEYTVLDCQNLNPGDASQASDVPSDVPNDPRSAGAEVGERDGCQALFEQQGVYSLNWGNDTLTENDCPAGGVDAPLPSRKSQRKAAPCRGSQADGTAISVRTDKGKVNCAGAIALWEEWLKRAPTEGGGSSGYLEFEGWSCSGALATAKSHLGSCEKLDKTASFTVVGA